MPDLARCVRFCIPFPSGDRPAAARERHNTFAGWPAMHALGAYYEIEVTCRGEPHPVTGYVASISEIDEAVREIAIPYLERAVRARPIAAPERLLAELLERLPPAMPTPIASVTWRLTPFFSLTMEAATMDRVVLRQQFSFAAAHRLHSPQLDDEENRAIFGKCNNAHGHGHNYRLEVAVVVPLETRADRFGLADLERIVDERVVQRFDHTHLNLDTPEFADVVPSVEHIARACHDLLREPIARAGGTLRPVTVWETDKTSCTFPGGA